MGTQTPERCIEAAFQFLLDREPHESILRRFDITVISHYFPEFERECHATSLFGRHIGGRAIGHARAIAGEIIGSRFEGHRAPPPDFELFHPNYRFTDDIVCTVAVADALLGGRDFAASLRHSCAVIRVAATAGCSSTGPSQTMRRPW
jgi:hypothetical protein